MSTPPLVSCLIATHDFAPYLARSIESVLAQEYPRERIQIVVVDDGSQDETPRVVEPYLDRVTYIRKRNGGLRSTINRGLAEARGDLITFHSGDDIWLPGRLALQVEQLQARPEVGLVYADMRVIDEHDETLAESFWAAEGISPVRGRPLARLMLGNVVSGGTLMVRASLRDRFWPMPDFAPWEDWWIALRVAEVAEIDYLEAPVFGYRRHGANMNLGADAARAVEIAAAELPLRRWMLTGLESDLVGAREWLAVARAWTSALSYVAQGQGVQLASLVPVSDEQERRARGAARVAGEHLAAWELENAARESVRALGLDPFAAEPARALTAVGTALDGGQASLEGLEVRGFVTLADGDELIEDRALLAGYGGAFSGADDASLVVLVGEERMPALSTVIGEAGLDGEDAAEIVALPVHGPRSSALASELAPHVHAVLGRRRPDEAFAITPHVDGSGAARLRSLAERRWVRVPASLKALPASADQHR